MNLLLDTNVLIDYIGKRKEFIEESKKIFISGFFGDAKIWISVQSFKDALYILSKSEDSKLIQQKFIKLCELVSPVDMLADDMILAAKLQWPDLEDCMISLAAEITRDVEGFKNSRVKAITPQQYIEIMKSENIDYSEIEL
ncbi:MAG: PIN domain-containing protein [Coriobacteriales bacterium]|nr:PIN domain-containing protein [Coriobacteriales bacterium]